MTNDDKRGGEGGKNAQNLMTWLCYHGSRL